MKSQALVKLLSVKLKSSISLSTQTHITSSQVKIIKPLELKNA